MDNTCYILLLPVLLPILAGVLLALLRFGNRKALCIYVFIVLALEAVLCAYIAFFLGDASLTLFTLAEGLILYYHVDAVSKIFLVLISFAWLFAGIFSFEYMEHEKNETWYFGVYLVVCGVLSSLALAGNLLTFYAFYEMMSVTSMPLVLHERTHASVMAALKYLFYSMAGALMALFGFFVLSYTLGGTSLEFTPGGLLSGTESTPILLAAVFLMIIGFGTKAGMFPMHAWLTAAHPVAPAPASAILSGVVTKMGVLGIIRAVFYVAGADFIRGTWVQTAWIVLSLTTVFMGSLLAYKEKVLKKRLAYSTVSQVSYVLFGFSTLNPVAFVGAILHVIFHALSKITLFLSAGSIISKTGKTRVDELRGIGKEMPTVMWCFTLASLSLIGIPPLCAFVSKWYLAVGALESGISVASWLGPAILLVSALLTAGYLLPVSINGFLPGKDYDYAALEKKEPTWRMLLPLVVLTVLSVLFGIWPTGLVDMISEIAAAVL